MRVLFCGSGWLSIVGALRARMPEHEVMPRDFERSFEEELATVHVILFSNAAVGEAQIAAAKVLRLIHQPAVGVDAIDLGAARSRGIPVCNSPGTNAQSASECAVLLMLRLALRANEAEEMPRR